MIWKKIASVTYMTKCKYSVSRPVVVPLPEARRFIIDCLVAAGAPKNNAEIVADVLILSDYRGHPGHGMNRLTLILKNIENKVCDPHAEPKIIKETSAMTLVDGQSALGPIVSKYCIDLGITKAKNSGVALILARNSHYNRSLTYYGFESIKAGMLALCFTNTTACMSPPSAKNALLGSNPICFAAPAKGDDHFLLDLATTIVSFGDIEMKVRKKSPLPAGCAKDKMGRMTTNALTAAEAGLILPIGGYKGFGLALMVEILCSVLSGANSMMGVKEESREEPNLSHCFVVINSEFFAPDFTNRMFDLLDYTRKSDPIDPKKPIMTAGDPERLHMTQVDKNGGIIYMQDQLETCDKLADELKVPALRLENRK